MTGISISQTKIGASIKEQNFFKMKVIAFKCFMSYSTETANIFHTRYVTKKKYSREMKKMVYQYVIATRGIRKNC